MYTPFQWKYELVLFFWGRGQIRTFQISVPVHYHVNMGWKWGSGVGK